MYGKASFTVEAAFVMPLICLFLCGMIAITFRLYDKVEQYRMVIEERELPKQAAQLIRLEALLDDYVFSEED